MRHDNEDNDENEVMPDDLLPEEAEDTEPAQEGGFDSVIVDLNDSVARQQLRGMYQSW